MLHHNSLIAMHRTFHKALCGVLASLLLMPSLGLAATNGEKIEFKKLELKPVRTNPNLLPNASFEKVDDRGIPTDWEWSQGATNATCTVDKAKTHGGRQAIRFTNKTEQGPHIFGSLYLKNPVRLVAGKTYTMSAWVYSDSPGIVGLIGGGNWQHRVQAAPTNGQWICISKTFVAEPFDCDFVFRINTEAPTPVTWVDDVKLEEGDAATYDPASGLDNPPSIDVERETMTVPNDGPFHFLVRVSCPKAIDGTCEVALSSGETLQQPFRVSAGVWQAMIQGDSTSADNKPRKLTLRLKENDRVLAQFHSEVRFCSKIKTQERIAALKAKLPSLAANVDKVKQQGQDVSYPKITYTILENFVGFVQEDAEHHEVSRAIEQLDELEQMASRLAGELTDALAGNRQFAPVPRWTGEKRATINRSSFVGPVRMPDGKTVDRPIFFTGYGHFGRVVADMERWPDYGANIIQIEVGPWRVFPAENEKKGEPIQFLKETLDRAQKAGVSICLLISPHYFPQWALEKWPHLNNQNEGFLKYCLHAPEGRELLRRFVSELLTPIKDHPALHSICISNEPVNVEKPCKIGETQWHAWLEKRHGDIATLNTRYKAQYASFSEVRLPDPYKNPPTSPLWMDFVRFNQDVFADWHQMLADAVHAVSPRLMVHSKAMTWTMLTDIDVRRGVDAYLFSKLSDINGNDSCNMYLFGQAPYAESWELNAMGYDLQRSMKDSPVFNTENHIITDRDFRWVPPAHLRAAMWQGAVHGQSATTIWVWERCFDRKSDLAGSIMHRPGCVEAVGTVHYDLNRAAAEMTAIQQTPQQAAVLVGFTPSVYEGAAYANCGKKIYEALSFTGLMLGFVSERQLEDGIVPNVPTLFVPDIVHLSDAAAATLRKYKGRLIFVGRDSLLARNEYDQERKEKWNADHIPYQHTPVRKLWAEVLAKLASWNVQPAVALLDNDGKPAWGVEWRTAETPEGLVVNLCNYLDTPVTITVNQAGKPAAATDVLTGKPFEGPQTLQPMEVRLLRVK
jgi:hypothetical protein